LRPETNAPQQPNNSMPWPPNQPTDKGNSLHIVST
jgi:hypothetical protein